MSAGRNLTLATPASTARASASTSDVAEMSIDVMLAFGLLRASLIVCAPTPHPASRTVLPGG
jgi:hypothetical protein